MDAAMFVAAAHAAVTPLFTHGTSVGTRIENAVEAAFAATGCNTNLGIVLLCAPLAAAHERLREPASTDALRVALLSVLERLDVHDARAAFRAIAAARPGGLGDVADHDVRHAATIDLRSAMALAAERDSVARQYANGYADVFDTGLRQFETHARESIERAVLETYLAYLRRWPDSHVMRKHGAAMAHAVQKEAALRSEHLAVASRDRQASLARWDAELKARGINPGTSADLVVATAFAFELTRGA
jgi:triphosphoribosyl-dephospho-CoA synthase